MNANYLIVGLGNHGLQYQKHRHNIGYIILDSLCNELHIEYENKKFSSILPTNVVVASTERLCEASFFILSPDLPTFSGKNEA